MDTTTATSTSAARPPVAAVRRIAASQSRRHAPYARPAANSQSPNSLANRVLGICRQISKPLFGRGAVLSSPDDAFVVPWRTVDRETYELRAELQKAQSEAAAHDQQQQLEQVEEKASAVSDVVADVVESRVAEDADSAPAAVAQVAYESVFDTARKIAERRATGLAADVEQASYKGKEVDR
ncbi:hypothetical protein GGI21_004743, partial [Coemansia aciculifera]